ncbi:MAG: glycine--tRNA ligase subunit beta [Nevskiaceae bacterium]|nr:MAG: glycine--tRNA ligase subunit beta [Nevskiaceae bacterium]
MAAHPLLIEIGTEDLPARYVVPLADALGTGVAEGLRKRGVVYQQHVQTFATPRRIAVLIAGVAAQQPEQKIDLTGPALGAALKDGQPTPAALGFARKCGVEFSALGQKDGKLHYAKTEAGRRTLDLIPEIFEETLRQMDELVPKRMRWGSGEETFVRPVQWLTALLGSDIVPLKRFGLTSGRVTYGHRFHAPAAIELKSPVDYIEKLKAAQVWAEVTARKAEIKRQIEAQAAALKGYARITEDLLDEVTALVEKPVAITGHFEDRFLELPPEVIVATVETNQRYFTVFKDAAMTQLTNAFITVSNVESKDVSQVIAGNERVVRPRLTDALFFWQQDLKQPLAAYGDRLKTVTFQKDLGSIGDKVARIRKLATTIAPGAATDRAALLCKNDLVTKMVYEFPELQGLMGGYYAAKAGEEEAVAKAIREHYLPTQQGTPIPSTKEGQAVALADKLDTLAGIFAIGQKPTASKDPFALRRAALGALRICIEGKLPLDLAALLKTALDAQPAGKRDAATLAELQEFVFERLRAYYEGLPIEMYEAVKALGITQPLDFDARVQALRGFWALPAAKNLAAAHKRVRNILKQAGDTNGTIDPQRFAHDAEKNLHAKMTALATQNAKADDATKLANLATLREPVDAFFEGVMVNDKDDAIRNNRLALLRQLDTLCREVADISLLPG